MWYWFYEIASVTLVIGLVALILWWAWWQETAGRFADTLDRRFAKEKPKVKWWRTKDWPESTLEQRVTALEEGRTEADNYLLELHRQLEHWKVCTATPSPPTASPTTDCPSGAAEQETIPAPFQQSWQSAQPTTNAGRVERFYDSADPPDAST